jgi:putative NADH-flavin reductase
MKLTILGATGGVGSQLVRQAVEQGHDVTAVVRDPSRLVVPGIRVVEFRFDSATTGTATPLDDAVSGADAVLSALGPRGRTSAGIAANGTRAALEAMARTGVRRVSVVSAAPIDGPTEHDTAVDRLIAVPLLNTVFRDVYNDLRNMEDTLRNSDTVWTSLRPPKLTNGKHRGTYRTAIGHAVRGGRFISRADVADALLRSLTAHDQENTAVGIAY